MVVWSSIILQYFASNIYSYSFFTWSFLKIYLFYYYFLNKFVFFVCLLISTITFNRLEISSVQSSDVCIGLILNFEGMQITYDSCNFSSRYFTLFQFFSRAVKKKAIMKWERGFVTTTWTPTLYLTLWIKLAVYVMPDVDVLPSLSVTVHV